MSPGFELFTAVCIEFPGLTIISAAAPIPDIDVNIRIATNKAVNFFIPIPPLIKTSLE
jgi:hypothetical protein